MKLGEFANRGPLRDTPHARGAASSVRSWLVKYESGGNEYIVRVVFSDETGIDDANPEPLIVVVALLVNLDRQWDALQSASWNAKNQLFSGPKFPEFKGRKLLKNLRRKDQRQKTDAALRELLEAVVMCRVPIFYEAVDRDGFAAASPFALEHAWARAWQTTPPPDHPYAFAFGGCAEQVHHYMATLLPKEKFLWISDHASKHEGPLRLSVQWQDIERFLHRIFHQDPRAAIPDQRIDSVYFGDSDQSTILQLADLCCSIIATHLRGDTIVEPYYRILIPAIVAERPILFAN